MLELLSPAGSPEAVVAAVQTGADAIYVGLGGFNARRGAKNFTEEEFCQAVKYCRERGCRVYVALNTLCADREAAELARLGVLASEAGAHGAIVQDLGAVKILRSACPDLPLHASTQMSVHNLAGVCAAAELGIKRVVLARELSLEQIEYIAKNSPIEVEVFVHGALCFSHSGQCYMSAFIGRRSGNRGMCAQPCRLPYSMGRRMDDYPLSLKDNCLLDYLERLDKAGVACVKIEGRMKRPEYAAIVTEVYAKAIHEGVAPTEKDMERLRLAFSRDGFTDGYISGKKQNMFGVRSEPDRDANRLFTEARRAYAAGEKRRVPIDVFALAKPGESFRLLVRDDEGNSVSLFGPVPEIAQRSAMTEESVSAQLYKTGGTPYYCRSIKCSVGKDLFLPASALNELRRSALEQLGRKRGEAPPRRVGTMPPMPLAKTLPPRPRLNIQVMSASQLTPELAELMPGTVYVPLHILAEAHEALLPFAEKGISVAAVLPRIITDSETEQVCAMLERAKAMGVSEALVGNIGHIAMVKKLGMSVRGDFGLNVFNSHTLETLARAGLSSATASFELRIAQIRDMVKSIDTEMIVYGRMPLMVTDQCIISASGGGCTCSAPANISDRMGSVFPVVKEFGCRNVILNAHKLFLADRSKDILACGLWAARLMFTTESPRECAEVMKSYMGLSEYRPNGLTRGLYYRGVE